MLIKLKLYKPLISFFISLLLFKTAQAQVSISGPSCIVAGVEYQYTISGSWNFTTYMDWCVTGGTITGSGGTCQSGTPLPQIYVTFTAGTGRRIDLYTSIGSASLIITVAATFNPGTATPASQNIYLGQTPATISCTAASGGSCGASYSYQWQQSPDNVNFTDISSATGQNLSFISGPSAPTYYRRKVTVSPDGTIGYSNTHTVFIIAPLNGGTISTPNQTFEYPTVPLALMASAAWGGGCSLFSYQWEESSDNINFTPITGATAFDYTFSVAPQRSRYYRRKVSCTGSQIAYTNTVYVIVVFKAGTLITSQSIAPGGTVSSLSFSGTSGGFGTSYSYQWESSTDEITWGVVGGAMGSSYVPPSPSVNTYYRVRVWVTAFVESACTNTICIRVTPVNTNNIPNGSVATASLTPVAMPAYPTGTDAANMNYIKARAFIKPGIADITTANAQTNKLDVAQSTVYFDGLGREWQTVTKSATPAGKDMVSTVWYDNYGRVVQSYLPYTDNLETGNFRTNPNTQQPAFYNTYFSNTESFYYAANVYENSPLNRALMQTAPGKSWGGNNKGVRSIPRANRLAEDVRMFTIAAAIGSVPAHTGIYSAGELMVTEATDEQDNKVIEYKERNGLVVLKKVQSSNILQDGHTNWLCTYYVYDDFRRLRYVIPPKAVEAVIAAGWSLANTTVQNELCFRYEYDGEGRMIIKKVPGAGEVWMVYDGRDRLVMTQDAKLRTQATPQWMVTKYDALNRPLQTGLWNNTSNRTTHQTAAASSTSYPTTSTGYEILSEIFYDGYTYAGVKAYDGSYNSQLQSGVNLYPVTNVKSDITTGMPTGSRVKVLGTASQYLISSIYYDHWGRVIQSQSDNQSTGVDIATNQYDFSGKVLSSYLRHQKNNAPVVTTTILSKLEYDHAGRVKNIKKILNGGTEKMIAQHTYDELGRMSVKQTGQKADLSFLETSDFKYNIRGWLQGINRGYANPNYGTESTNQANRWFGMELLYDYGFVKNQYNGNIGGIRWKSTGDDEQRAYGFDYDNVNRLLKADFNQYTSSAWNTTAGIDFSLSNMSYDANGNIMTLNQKGLKLNVSPTIDQLTYTYNLNTNRLAKVADAAVPVADNGKLGDFKDGSNGTGNDYIQDVNGNLTLDHNKAISSITYNHLNLPLVITTSKGTITYTYDAVGSKQKKVTLENPSAANNNITTTTTTTYIGGFVYETKTDNNAQTTDYTDRLQFAAHEEGRIRYKYQTSSFEYDYMIKDHLGNVRMVLTEEQQTDMYPAATMETAAATTEETYYSNLPQTRTTTLPPGYPPNTPPGNAKVAKVTGSGVAGTYKVGPGITLKVMAGDKFNLQVNSWWSGSSPNATITNPLSEILGILTTGVASQSGGKVTATELNSSGVLSPGVQSFLTTQNTITGRPRAYINWVLFDEQFKIAKDAAGNIIASGYSGFDQVGGSGTYTPHTQVNVPLNKSGYLYVYVSNETPNIDVFFDNLQVTHIRGALLETNEYYPFGLQMRNLSYRSLKNSYRENKSMFNDGTELASKEFSDGSGLEIYETPFRGYDPQIGRFHQIDQLADIYHEESPYIFAFNNPVNFNDPLGLEGSPPQFNNAQELLTYIQQNGIAGFGSGFTSYTFGDNGETTSTNYDPNPQVGKNKKGEDGIFVKYSYSINNGYSEGFGSAVLDEFVVGQKFINAENFLSSWNEYIDYLEENDALEDWFKGFRGARTPFALGAMAYYYEMPKIVTRYTGKEGWWFGKNRKFNRTGWGGNGRTGGRSIAKGISTKLGVAAKVLGGAAAVFSAGQAINDFQNGNNKAGVIHSVDAIMGVIAFIPGGAAISTVYFLSRMFWGNDD
jgi:RHS repeat-associated protein